MVMTVQTPNAITAMSNLLMAIALAISACSQPETRPQSQQAATVTATEVAINPGPTNSKTILIDGSSAGYAIVPKVGYISLPDEAYHLS
jgi:hypothetical protein